jgi:hypothetical protein
MFPRASWRPRAIWCVRVRTRVWMGCVTGIGCRSSVYATAGRCRPAPGRSCGANGSASSASSSPVQQQTFDTYVHAVDLVDARIEQLEGAIRETAQQQPWRQLVARLRCLRGLTALTLALVAEIGDFSRFQSAAELMAFVGLVPTERSSGEKRRQGSITKVGNSHVRRLLVESAAVVERSCAASSSASTSAGSGWPDAADRTRRSSSPAPASSPASSGRSRPSNHSGAPDREDNPPAEPHPLTFCSMSEPQPQRPAAIRPFGSRL